MLLVCQLQMSRWLQERKYFGETSQEKLRIVSECRERLEAEACEFRLELFRWYNKYAELEAVARRVRGRRCVVLGSSGQSRSSVARVADERRSGSFGG